MCQSSGNHEPSQDICKTRPVAWGEPNKYARPLRLELCEHYAILHGYQEFVLTKDSVRVSDEDPNLLKKWELLTTFFRPGYLEHRTVLDLGANAGFFCFWALQNGASKAIALDMDENYLRILEEARAKLGFENLEVVKSNVLDWNDPADNVLALALIHWIYSCTALFGSIDSIIEKLAQLTKYMIIVEWVDPADPAIDFFHHLDWNKESVRGPYTLEAFETALALHFPRYKLIGNVSPTRKLYVAFRTMHEIDLSGPLPIIMSKEHIIHSRRLAENNGIEYWSRVYDDGNVIRKQATLDLAEREAYFLSKLSSDYFPRVHDAQSEDDYSWVVLEKIRGVPLMEAAQYISASPSRLHAFIQHCLNLLSELKQKGIVHRDIRPGNILVRDEKPILIDFGWAISDTRPYFTPQGLGRSERPPDGSFCDVYSMGKVFEQINRYAAFDSIIQLMTDPDANLRIADLGILRILFMTAAERTTQDEASAL